MTTNYIYSQNVFVNGLNLAQLQDEISVVFVDLLGINKFGSVIEAVFSRALNSTEHAILTNIISVHVPKPALPEIKSSIINLLQLHQPIVIYSTHSIGFFPWNILRYSALSNGICLFSCDESVKVEIWFASQLLGELIATLGGDYTFPVSLPTASSGVIEVKASKISTLSKIISLSLEWTL